MKIHLARVLALWHLYVMANETTTWRIWLLWTSFSENCGLTVQASDEDAALAAAARMGTFSGLGRRPSYLGAKAVRS